VGWVTCVPSNSAHSERSTIHRDPCSRCSHVNWRAGRLDGQSGSTTLGWIGEMGIAHFCMNNVRRMKSLVFFITLVVLSGCMPMAIKAKRYEGDGVLHVCSTWLGQGYTIDFPLFPSDQPYSASYKLSHIPNVGRDPFVYLRFHSSISSLDADSTKKRVTAAFHVVLLDSTGRETQHLDLPLSKAIWSQSRDLFGVYDLDRSVFHFNSVSNYTLQISYEPGSFPPPTKQLYFEIDGCAYY